ncbi:16S rRNA processing protein [Oryzomicrobium terrae]|uniref:Ribosome maturation factor RimM n=1 Tax=Oryzomicrobium terrae TaxID=1735038 RepID=A0A5C1E6K3_9RHOO|nr:ribosome maturation factor RimM [Oryzomicrobium terrae]QEL64264.1 16S rRNA processing protein [Oryzomicrobium terrae]
MTDAAGPTEQAAPVIVLGRITDAYGVRGWVRIHPFGDDPLEWGKMLHWWVGSEESGWKVLPLAGCKWHGDGLVAQFVGVADRSGAEALKGAYIGAPREEMPRPEPDAYYWNDLIGLPVQNLEGESFGTVVGLLATGANDVLQVREDDDGTAAPGKKPLERLLPFVEQVVREVILPAKGAPGVIRVDWQKDW